MADNELALERMFNLCDKLANKEILFVDFINEFEKICYQDMSSNGVSNFADGYSKACVSNLMKYVLRAYDGDVEAKRRLEIDLHIEDYDLSDDLKVIHL